MQRVTHLGTGRPCLWTGWIKMSLKPNDLSYFSVLPLHPLVSKFQGTLKKVISFVMCDSLFASVYTGNFLMGPPVILLPLISKRHPGTV